MSLNENTVIFLLGAGASTDAGLQTSEQIICSVEDLVSKGNVWDKYQPLYNCVKSGIFYRRGLSGQFSQNMNVEILMDTLGELTKRHEHTLSPFIGSWVPKLAEINYEFIEELRDSILEKLVNEWIDIKNVNTAGYYQNFCQFYEDFGFPLHIFSLNYDLCVEKTIDKNIIERGFNLNSKEWDHTRYESYNIDEGRKIRLYKMHGSMDWQICNGKITEIDGYIPANERAIIFGTTYKLRYIDPFLFFINEFRKKILGEAELLVTIGYSFSDDHINTIVTQAFNSNDGLRILNVRPSGGKDAEQQQEILEKLSLKGIDPSRIIIENCSAKDFLNEKLSEEYVKKKLNIEDPF